MTVRPSTPFRSAVTVSMIPVPSQSSSGLFVMFEKSRTAIVLAGAAGPDTAGAAAAPPRASASRSSRASRIDAWRRVRSFSSIFATTASSAGGTPAAARERGAGSAWSTRSSVSTVFAPSNGFRPDSAS